MKPEYFRKQAATLLTWAHESADPANARWLRMKAQEFLDKADEIGCRRRS